MPVDPWVNATMTAPPTALGGTWTTVYDTSTNPTPVFEDWSVGSGANTVNGLRLRVLATGGAAIHLYGVVRPRPGGAYDLIARFRLPKTILNNQTIFTEYGLFMRESGTGKIHTWTVFPTRGLNIASWSNTHTVVNSIGQDGTNSGQSSHPWDFWLRIHDDHAGTGASGHLTHYASLDGNYWVSFGGSVAYNSSGVDFTSAPDQIGFGMNCADPTTGTECVMEVGSWFAG